MRKLTFIGIVAVGALVGLLAAANDDWATRTVLGTVGALFGAAIGGALTRLGWSKKALLAGNFWRDNGHPPFMKPPDADSDPGSPR